MANEFNDKINVMMDVTPHNYSRVFGAELGHLLGEALTAGPMPITSAHVEVQKVTVNVEVPTDVAVATLETRRVELQRKLEQKVEDLVKARV